MITWKVTQMHLYPQQADKTDVVFNVTWRCEASDQGFTAFASDNAKLTISQESFIPYEDLTEETVLGWVWSVVNKGEIEAKAQAEVEKLINPTVVVKRLPWDIPPPAPEPEPSPEPQPDPAPEQTDPNQP